MKSYYELNKSEYRRRWVGYSWRKRNLDEVRSILESKGYRVEKKGRDFWDREWYVRDGSFLILQDFLTVYRGDLRIADVTETKAMVMIDEADLIEALKGMYHMKVSPREFIFSMFILFMLIFVVMRG